MENNSSDTDWSGEYDSEDDYADEMWWVADNERWDYEDNTYGNRFHKIPNSRSKSKRSAAPRSQPTTASKTSCEKILVQFPFKERQQGSLCRMHALNAFFGEPRLTQKKFHSLCTQFDRAMGYSDRISRDFFYVDSGENLISWIVEKESHYKTKYFPPGKISSC